MFWVSWKEFSRIFDNKFDTFWWFGEGYYKQQGDKWPYEGEEPPEGYVYPSAEGFKMALLCAILLTVVRFTIERLIAEPLGKWFGLKHNLPGTPPGPNETLEALMKSNKYKKPSHDQIKSAAESAKMEIRAAEIWIKRRQRQVMPSKLNKFKESFWRFIFYLVVFVYGLNVVLREDFFWNTKLCWVGFPLHTWAIKKGLYYYYLAEGSFYMSLMVSQFMDTQRKDFWEMLIHHIATLSLIGLSYFNGTYRVGVLVMVTHDISDVFLESAKLAVYTKKTTWSNVMFAGFASSFFICRLIIYPFKITYTAVMHKPYKWAMGTPMASATLALQVLHIVWFTIIFKMLIKVVTGGKVDKDTRSESDESMSSSDEEEELEEKKKN